MADKKPAKEKDPNPGVQGQAAEQHAASLTPNFGWAVNAVKLNRAKAFVRQTNPDLKGKELETAVKARYAEIKGLLVEDKPEGKPTGKVRGRVKNMAEDDGSED